MTRWHYTCRHAAEGIERTGTIEPHHQPLLGVDLAWFTDIDVPDRDALGLTSVMLRCDRMAWRYEVGAEHLVRWTAYRRLLLRAGNRSGVHALESTYGALPASWWVADRAVPLRKLGQLTSHDPYGAFGPGVVIPR